MGRNWDFAKQRGRKQRLDAELNAFENGIEVPLNPPLFSHDATMQSYFSKAWSRVSQNEIDRHLGIAKTPQGNDLVSKIRSLRECHFQSSRG
ncbi:MULTISPECIES: hypothetical protein [Vibrio]|uniref:hypothetical protein n=1 Tax=Vibrio TaxID=662 RepID=UPI000C8570EC|nr:MULTISPECIES: hypothetical protein [Vibrio]PMG63009.1 hypothetical protein BCU89_00115 [Vibrio splendidus]